MFTGNPVDTTRAEPERGIIPRFTASSLCACRNNARQDFFKGTSPRPIGRRRGINISGVDFWHAVEFSRNGRFLCTHPLGLSSGRFPSVLRFRLYQTLSGLTPSQRGLPSRPLGRSDVSNFSGSSRQFLIGPPGPNRIEFGHTEFTPAGI